MAEKRFHLAPDRIRPIVTHRGGCIVSDRILVDGTRVGFMFREQPGKQGESGWTFMAGDEDQAFCEDPSRWELCDVNTVANHDIEIVRFLDQPPGSEYVRGHDGKLVRARESKVPEAPVLTLPDASGETVLDGSWCATFPARFKRRIEGEHMVIWRPGLTFWMQGWNTNEQDSASVRAHLEANLPPGARDLVREQDGDSWRTLFRVDSSVADKRRPALLALIWSRGHVLQVTAYFDDEADLASTSAVIRSIRARSAG